MGQVGHQPSTVTHPVRLSVKLGFEPTPQKALPDKQVFTLSLPKSSRKLAAGCGLNPITAERCLRNLGQVAGPPSRRPARRAAGVLTAAAGGGQCPGLSPGYLAA